MFSLLKKYLRWVGDIIKKLILYLISSEKNDAIDYKIMLADIKTNAAHYLISKVVLLVICFMIIFIIYNWYVALLITILFFYFFDNIFIDYQIKKREEKLDHEALYFIEILVLTLETGSTLEKGLETACTNIDSDVSYQFNRVLIEMKFGKSLSEALKTIKVPSETINNLVLIISETSDMGTRIVDCLKEQIDFLNTKNFLKQKEAINKIPFKISIVSVLLILPLVLLLILGPLIIDFLK